MLVCGGWGWGVDGGWMPLSTCLQRYCNPVLHVFLCFSLCFSLPLSPSVCLSLSLSFSLPFSHFLSPSLSLSLPFSHVTWGYNIVADRWTGASSPHPHSNPYTQVSRPLVFPLFRLDGQTDQQTDGWTDGQSLSF